MDVGQITVATRGCVLRLSPLMLRHGRRVLGLSSMNELKDYLSLIRNLSACSLQSNRFFMRDEKRHCSETYLMPEQRELTVYYVL